MKSIHFEKIIDKEKFFPPKNVNLWEKIELNESSQIKFLRSLFLFISSTEKHYIGYIKMDAYLLFLQKSRKFTGVIKELMVVTVEAIGTKLPLLFQILSQLVGACWFFLSKSSVQFQRWRKVVNFVKSARGEPSSATQSMYVNLIYAFCRFSIDISHIIITRPTRFCSALLFTTNAANTLCIYLFETIKVIKSAAN